MNYDLNSKDTANDNDLFKEESKENKIRLIYRLERPGENIRLVGSKFFHNNKDKCKMVINFEEKELLEFYKSEKNENTLMVILALNRNITDISYIFYECSSLILIYNLCELKVDNITDLSYIFYGCSSLNSLPDISNWNTSEVTDMSYMFYGCKSLKELPSISKWQTHNVTNMSYMFYGCSSLTSLEDISKWNTDKVTNITKIFGIRHLSQYPDISKWKCYNNNEIFEKNDGLKIIPQKKNKSKSDEMINELNKRQHILRKKDDDIKIEKEEKNDNVNWVKEAGKSKSLSNEEIVREIKKVKLLEDMNIMGTIMKEKIIEEKKINPEKFYSTQEIIEKKEDEKEKGIFGLGVLSKVLESQGMVTAIEKDSSEESKESSKTALQFLVNGLSDKAKYDLHFDFGEEKNNKLLKDENERKIFHNKLRKKLSKEYNINEEDIIITFPRKGSYQVSIIFKSPDFKLNENELIKKFKNEKDELSKLKKIETGLVLSGCRLNPSMLDYRGNNCDGGWAEEGERRGNEEYIPPHGWIGYGLNVMDVYKDNIWLGMNNCDGEWCVAYHGVARDQSSQEVSKITKAIIKGGFKPSTWGAATDDDDLRHPGAKCGLGVYCSPDINYAEEYAGEIQFNNITYKCVLMLRVNPKKIRQSKSYPKEYILDANTDEIRPYRILLKKS